MILWGPTRIARLLGVARQTVQNWLATGHLPYVVLPVSGYKRVNPEVLADWLHNYQRSDLAQRVLTAMAERKRRR